MGTKEVLGGLALVLWLTVPAAADHAQMVQTAHEKEGGSVDDAAPPTHGHGHGRWHRHHMSGSEWRGERPLISIALRHRQELGLAPAQVEGLDRLRSDFLRDAIRREADRRVAELDLAMLLRPDPADPGKPVDMGKVEAKVREIERVRADLQISRIRTIEQGKALLTAEQQEKLRALLAAPWPRRGSGAGGMRPEPTPKEQR